MHRALKSYLFLLVTALPMVAWANPNSDSPEPEFWAFLALGSLPVMYMIWRQSRGQQQITASIRDER